jgi:hypothetical protein
LIYQWLNDLGIVFAGWSIMLTAYCGWGRFAANIVNVNLKGYDRLFLSTWLGWAILLLFFNIANLLFPINWLVGLIFFLPGSIYFFKTTKLCAFRRIRVYSFKNIITVLLFLLVLVWLASRSMLSPIAYDSGLYHFNSIRWLNECHIVPGLGNLHGRLAFNQTFFTYVASLNLYPIFNKGHHLANSFLLLLFFTQCYTSLVQAVSSPKKIIRKGISYYDSSALFLIPAFFSYLLRSSISSPNPDVGSTVIMMVIFIYFVKYVEDYPGKDSANAVFATIFILASSATTIKLSNVVFAGVIIVIVVLYELSMYKMNIFEFLKKQNIVKILIISSLIIVVWSARGIISSGYPVYPSTYIGISFEWSVPEIFVQIEKDSIRGWARQPGPSWRESLDNWDWLMPWVNRNLISIEGILLRSYPVLTSLLITSMAVIVRLYSKQKRNYINILKDSIFYMPIVMSFLFWFFSAPSFRFVNGLLFIFPIAAFLSFRGSTSKLNYNNLVVCGIAFLIINISYGIWFIKSYEMVKILSLEGFQEAKIVDLIAKETLEGVEIWIPVDGDQVWDSPLPSTPYFNEHLKLRGENICDGFLTLR